MPSFPHDAAPVGPSPVAAPAAAEPDYITLALSQALVACNRWDPDLRVALELYVRRARHTGQSPLALVSALIALLKEPLVVDAHGASHRELKTFVLNWAVDRYRHGDGQAG